MFNDMLNQHLAIGDIVVIGNVRNGPNIAFGKVTGFDQESWKSGLQDIVKVDIVYGASMVRYALHERHDTNKVFKVDGDSAMLVTLLGEWVMGDV